MDKLFYKKYKPEFEHSYTLGLYPTLELVRHHAQDVIAIVLHSSAVETEGGRNLRQECERRGVVVEVDDRIIERLSLKDNIHAVGIFRKYTDELSAETNHVVLVEPADMGNLGTIMRTMLAFGFHDLAVIKPAADIFHPKCLRSSMGANFSINVKYFDSFDEYSHSFPRHYYALMLKGASELDRVEFQPPFSLIFGNESSGLPDSFADIAQGVKINHSSKVDSLNLSMACGIVLHKLKQFKA